MWFKGCAGEFADLWFLSCDMAYSSLLKQLSGAFFATKLFALPNVG
jgi:hypothetical protein